MYYLVMFTRSQGDGKRAVGALFATVISIGNAVLFEALTVIATQDKTVRAASPWQDDPFDAVLSFAQFTVPAVCVVIAMRLPLWRLAGSPDRARQVQRAALVATTLVTVTLGFEWVAVGARAHHAGWDGTTGWLVAGLLVSSAATVSTVFCLTRTGAFYRSRRSWTHDWLGDAFVALARVPGLRKLTTPGNADLVRRHGVLVFAGASAIGAVLVVAALAVGERWTNPMLIGWALVVEATSNFAFCMISNAVVGFIAYPPRSRRRHAVETAITAGCVAIQVAVTFRDPLWRALGGTSPTSVADLALLTDGAGVLVGLIAFAFLLQRRPPAPLVKTAARHDIGA